MRRWIMDPALPHANIALKLAQARLQQAQGAFDWDANGKIGVSRLYYPRAETRGWGLDVLTDKLDSSDRQCK